MSAPTRVRFGDLWRGLKEGGFHPGRAVKSFRQLTAVKPGRRLSIGGLLEAQAAAHGDRMAVLDADRRYTYRQLDARASRVAAFLRGRGIGRGGRVGLLMENRPDLIAVAAGVVKAGAGAAMLNPNLRGDALRHGLTLTDPGLLVVGSECREAFESIRDRLPASLEGRVWCLLDSKPPATPIDGPDDLEAALPDEAAARDPAQGGADPEITTRDPAFYVFTSGTTGLPKAAVMSHGRWLKAMAGVGLLSLRMEADDVLYCPLPLHHNNALTISWSATMGSGAALALSRKFSASRFWDEVVAFDATVFCYIGELCRYLLQAPPHPKEQSHRLRAVIGNGLRPDLWAEFKSRFGIAHVNEFYGASEGNLVFTNGFNVDGACGFSPYAYRVVACDPDTGEAVRDGKGRLVRVRPGEVGLLVAKVTRRSPYDGYTDPEASERKLLRDGFRNGDCWFDTGDLVRELGWRHVAFVDRLGDTFRWKGENVATTEVEQALNAFEGVAESVVYGVTVPGAEGRAGMAVVVPADGRSLDGEALAAHLAERLPAYAVPVFLRVRAEAETTQTFKYRKADLKREGFDPAAVAEPLLVLADRDRGYEPLTAERHRKILEGALRL